MSTDAQSRCVTDLEEMYTAIMEAMKGGSVQSAGHKGRQVAYNPANVNQQIAFYNQLWDRCGNCTDLPRLNPVDTSNVTRGRRVGVRFKH